MIDELTFMMGEFKAVFPTDRQYVKNHMWAQQQERGVYRFGFTAYAVRLLQDVYFLDWNYEAGVALKERQTIGSIESKKAESDLFSPAEGRLDRINDALLQDPSAINVDKYAAGWLFEMQVVHTSFMSPETYLEHLAGVWEVTQRTIKGQLNE